MYSENLDDKRTERQTLERESDITFFVAGGPGGQHRNKVATGVRLYHRPTGIVVTATERRSQTDNREMAFERLIARLTALYAAPPPPRIATKPSRTAVARRQQHKRQRAAIKQSRRRVDGE